MTHTTNMTNTTDTTDTTELGLSMKDTYKMVREKLEPMHMEQLFKIKDAIIGFWGNNDPILDMINIDVKRLCIQKFLSRENTTTDNFIEEMRIAKRNGEIIEMPIEFDINLFLGKLYDYYNY